MSSRSAARPAAAARCTFAARFALRGTGGRSAERSSWGGRAGCRTRGARAPAGRPSAGARGTARATRCP
eukprot:scaffold2483_cov135-Isochrysis_galbana.AAC.7